MDVSEYNKGNGKIKLRAKIEHHESKSNRLVITQLPHGVTTDTLMSSIEDAVKKKKVPVRAIDDFNRRKGGD